MAASRQPYNVTERAHHYAVARATAQQQHSPWNSPVPYLFGGLAAMLGLIAFALLILACSYWKLSGSLDGSDDRQRESDLETGEGKKEGTQKPLPLVFEEKILVILAGEVKPTHLATLMSSRSSSFGDNKSSSSSRSSCGSDNSESSVEMAETALKDGDGGGNDHVQITDGAHGQP